MGRMGTIHDGDTIDLEVRLGPVPLRWRARHEAYREGKQFCDVQDGGPFKLWRHVHSTSPVDGGNSILDDDVTYQLPASPVSDWIAGGFVAAKFDRMFTYRHRTTREDLRIHARYGDRSRLTVAITGSSGLIGRALSSFLSAGGHRLERILREGSDTPSWSIPEVPVDAVVHLAGESVDGRWTDAKRRRIRDSRVEGTKRLVDAILERDERPGCVVCASAIGFYGDRGTDMLGESSDAGTGFLSDVCQDWESETRPLSDAGIRVVQARFGVILSGFGGALPRMLPPFRSGLGGRLGSGAQYVSWVSLDDAVGAIHHALMEDHAGPMNVVAPFAVTNQELTWTLGRILGRPTPFPVPSAVARLAFGEMADAMLLSSTRCVPDRLASSGYDFRYPDLEDCLRFQLGRMPLSEEAR